MLTQIKSKREDTLTYELDGYITEEDVLYIAQGVEYLTQYFDSVNLMICINAKGERFSTFIKELQFGNVYANKIRKIAYVSNRYFWRFIIGIDNLSTKYQEKYFDINDVAKAWDWIEND